MNYTLEAAATNAKTDAETLRGFQRAGWIQIASQNGSDFVHAHQLYRARFILALQSRLKLSDANVAYVLSESEAPFSLEQVPSILATRDKA